MGQGTLSGRFGSFISPGLCFPTWISQGLMRRWPSAKGNFYPQNPVSSVCRHFWLSASGFCFFLSWCLGWNPGLCKLGRRSPLSHSGFGRDTARCPTMHRSPPPSHYPALRGGSIGMRGTLAAGRERGRGNNRLLTERTNLSPK